ncbi:TadE/TadG family type IV pilus assembly protein [Aurantimonas sp. A2-1-M11]|uniref:TadE/TadG family type IV pilus assembly protein n=1 Tax=Aurantimonas sp. A2-1-M11 TaxID=3113712 RepID=UPI002F923E05
MIAQLAVPFRRTRERLSAFWANRRGVAALEFAIILPGLLLIYLGGFEASKALEASRKVESTAETVGNLVARNRTMTSIGLQNIYDISAAIMVPFPTEGLTMIVTTVSVDATGKGTVDWSRANTGPALNPGDPYTVPPELVFDAATYLVVVTVSYPYNPVMDYGGFFGGTKMTKEYTFRPRISKSIVWDNS